MKTFSTTVTLFTEAGSLIKSRLQRALPLSFAQYQTLSFVAQRARPGMQDVARHFKITAPSATFLVDELARGGLLSRRANRNDRRKIELALTSKGKGVLRICARKREQVLGRMFKVLNEDDRNDLNRVLKKLMTVN